MTDAKFVFEFDTESDAMIVFESIFPEINQKISKTNIRLNHSGKKLELTISSMEVCALRAACNSYLRWISTVIDVKKVV